ncbi:MAG: hypothetical protein J6L00_05570, partial [Clostridia bacterium]|nr:hypothetical protein [Clostridia bacterium]
MENIWRAVRQFDLPQAASGCSPYGNGHINDTFLVLCPGADNILASMTVILTRINLLIKSLMIFLVSGRFVTITKMS